MIGSIEKHQFYCHIKGGTWGNTIYDDICFSWIWVFIFLSEARMVLNRHIHQRLERFCTLRISDRSACPLLQIVAARYADTWRSLIDRFRIPSATTFRPESMNFLRPDEFHKRCFPGNPQLLVIACYSPYMPIPSIDLHFPRRAPCGFV